MITYRKDFKCWWPDYDHKPEVNFEMIKRSLTDIQFTAKLCKSRDQVIQAGGHAGFWPLELAKAFKTVHTFEPEPALHECLKRNTEGSGIHVWKLALGGSIADVKLRPHCSAGSWRVCEVEGKVPVRQVSIDSLRLSKVSAIFLDIEGYEPEALRGARETIDRCRPVIHVEVLPRSADEIRSVLFDMKYKVVKRLHKDEVYVPL